MSFPLNVAYLGRDTSMRLEELLGLLPDGSFVELLILLLVWHWLQNRRDGTDRS